MSQIMRRVLNGKSFTPTRTVEEVKALGFTVRPRGAFVPFTPEQIDLVSDAFESYKEDPVSALHGYTDIYRWIAQKILHSERSLRDVKSLIDRLARTKRVTPSSQSGAASYDNSESDSMDGSDSGGSGTDDAEDDE